MVDGVRWLTYATEGRWWVTIDRDERVPMTQTMIAVTPDGLVITQSSPLFPRGAAIRERLRSMGWQFAGRTGHAYVTVYAGELWCDMHDSTYPCPGEMI